MLSFSTRVMSSPKAAEFITHILIKLAQPKNTHKAIRNGGREVPIWGRISKNVAKDKFWERSHRNTHICQQQAFGVWVGSFPRPRRDPAHTGQKQVLCDLIKTSRSGWDFAWGTKVSTVSNSWFNSQLPLRCTRLNTVIIQPSGSCYCCFRMSTRM